MKHARWLTVAVVVLLTGCGGSGHNTNPEGSIKQIEAREKRAQQREAHREHLGRCLQAAESEAAMVKAVTAASRRGAYRGAFEVAVLDVETLRTKLAELATSSSVEQTEGLEKSRFFLLRVSLLLEAIETGNHVAARNDLKGYAKGMEELPEHLAAVCKA